MKTLHTEIEIDAPAARVWQILTDFDRFPEWNPFMPMAGGQLAEGARLDVQLQPPGGRGMAIQPVVQAVVPEREIRWLGHLFVPGLFDGEHGFTIEPLGENRVRFVQREAFTGLFVSPILRLIGERTRRGFEAMNQALKAQAEAGA